MNHGQVHNSELPSDYEPFDTENSGLEVRELLRRLWGYKWLIAVIMALGVGGTWITVQQLVPRYTATAVLMIEPAKKNIIILQEVVEGLDTGSERPMQADLEQRVNRFIVHDGQLDQSIDGLGNIPVECRLSACRPPGIVGR